MPRCLDAWMTGWLEIQEQGPEPQTNVQMIFCHNKWHNYDYLWLEMRSLAPLSPISGQFKSHNRRRYAERSGHDFDFLPGHVIYRAKSIEYRWISFLYFFFGFIPFQPAFFIFVAIKARLKPRTGCDNAPRSPSDSDFLASVFLRLRFPPIYCWPRVFLF